MLTHPTSERLVTLGLTGMASALDEQRRAAAAFDALCFEDRPSVCRSTAKPPNVMANG